MSFRAKRSTDEKSFDYFCSMMIDKDREIKIMAIVNLTDDSYFADSRCGGVDAAMERIATILDEGADIIDIGACSTRPGSLPVGEEEEWRRLEPVLKAVRSRWPDVVLSIDTYWSSVVRRAYAVIGRFIVNDISAGTIDPAMLPTVGELKLQYVAMHIKGTPETMQDLADYQDVTADVIDYFKEFESRASDAGIEDWILDPGFGFAKTLEQNYELLSHLSDLNAFLRPILVGVSRKSMIYRKFNISPEDSLPATQVLHLLSLERGSDILRVHDVAEARRTVELYKIV